MLDSCQVAPEALIWASKYNNCCSNKHYERMSEVVCVKVSHDIKTFIAVKWNCVYCFQRIVHYFARLHVAFLVHPIAVFLWID